MRGDGVRPGGKHFGDACGAQAGLRRTHRRAQARTAGADNHDVISLQVHDSHTEGKVAAVQLHQKAKGVDDLTLLVMDLEHQLTSVTEKLVNTIGKLQKQEDLVSERVAELQKAMSLDFMKKVESRITNLERSMDRKMQKTVHEKINSDIDRKLGEKLGDIQTGGWKVPFGFMIVTIIVVVAVAYRKYNQLRKSHLL